jgi:hypothetical protein
VRRNNINTNDSATLYLKDWKEQCMFEGLEGMLDSDFGLSPIPSTGRQFAHDIIISMMLYHARWCISAIEDRLREIRVRSMSDGEDAGAATFADLEENVASVLEVATTIFGQPPGSWMISQFPLNESLAVGAEHSYSKAIFIVNAQQLERRSASIAKTAFNREREDAQAAAGALIDNCLRCSDGEIV